MESHSHKQEKEFPRKDNTMTKSTNLILSFQNSNLILLLSFQIVTQYPQTGFNMYHDSTELSISYCSVFINEHSTAPFRSNK